jgi:hypothetical protein
VVVDEIWSSLTADAVKRAVDGKLAVTEDHGVDGRVLLPSAPIPVRDVLVDALRTALTERGEPEALGVEDAGARLSREDEREVLSRVAAFGKFYVGFVASEEIGYEGYRTFRLGERGYFYAIPRADAPADVVPVVIGGWEPLDAQRAFHHAAQRAADPLSERIRGHDQERTEQLLREIPEIRDEPAWAQMKEQQRLPRIEDAHPMLLVSLVFELLKRSLDDGSESVATRGFAVVEAELGGSTMQSTLAEFSLGQLFKEGFGDRAERFLGPRSRGLLERFRSADTFWQPVVERLDRLYVDIRERVLEAYPWIHADSGHTLDEGGRWFSHELWFELDHDGWSYPPDLSLTVSCKEVDGGPSKALKFRIKAESDLVASLPPKTLSDDLATDEARSLVRRYLDDVESLARGHVDRIVAELASAPSVREMRRYREAVESNPGDVDPKASDDEWASAMTSALRASEHPAWKLLRERVTEEGLDPRLCAVGDLLPDMSGENDGDHGVLVAPDGRVFGFTVSVFQRRRELLEAHIVEWREFTSEGPLFAHRDAIERGRSLVGHGGPGKNV